MAINVKKTKLQYDTTGGTTWAGSLALVGLNVLDKSKEVAEDTVMEATNDYRTHETAGFKDGNEVQVRVRYTGATYTVLDGILESDVLPNWRITLPLESGQSNGATVIFKGHMTRLSVPEKSVEGANVWECEFTIKITGKPAWTAGS